MLYEAFSSRKDIELKDGPKDPCNTFGLFQMDFMQW